MQVETTLGVLAGAEPALARLAALKLPARTAYHIAKLVTLVRQETKHFHDQRLARIKEFGEARPATPPERAMTGDDTVYECRPDTKGWTEFQKTVTELVGVRSTVAWGPIKLSWLGTSEVAAEDLVALGPLLEDDTAPAQEPERKVGKTAKRRGT